jgi:hypothetical protein
MSYRDSSPVLTVLAWVFAVLAAISILIGVVFVYKKEQVWMASQGGKAFLAEAEFSRQARVDEARAKKAAAELEGQAELTRAEFSAKANAALSDGLGGPEAYLRYLYIRMLEEQGNAGAVIYIPTEAGMPILEANRLK